MSGEAEIVGAKYSEMTVTVGCSPSNVSFPPPPSMLVVASVVQVVMLEECGAIASKVNMTLPPCGITAPPLVAVRLIDVIDRV